MKRESEGCFIFCCLNSTYKIDPTVFDVWANILKAVPDSVLWLLDNECETTLSNLRKEIEQRGIDSKRLIFRKHIAFNENLACYKLADLFLDTFIYNAGATAISAISPAPMRSTFFPSNVLKIFRASSIAA